MTGSYSERRESPSMRLSKQARAKVNREVISTYISDKHAGGPEERVEQQVEAFARGASTQADMKREEAKETRCVEGNGDVSL